MSSKDYTKTHIAANHKSQTILFFLKEWFNNSNNVTLTIQIWLNFINETLHSIFQSKDIRVRVNPYIVSLWQSFQIIVLSFQMCV